MVSLTLNKQQLLKDLDVRESDELFHQMAMLGIDVESVENDAVTVDITPNRPDLLSQAGITRALRSFLGKSGVYEYTTTKSKLKVRVDPSVATIRPFTACAVAKNLKLNEEKIREIIDIQEKLHVTFCRKRKRAAIGVYPMESIHGNIAYKAMKPSEIKFRPLESPKRMTISEILTKHPKGKEYAHLLKGLPLYPVFLDGKNEVLSVPPIINSYRTGKVTEKTTSVFIEASGHDFRVCHEVVRIICAALADMGASIQTVDVQYGRKSQHTPDMKPTRQRFFGYYVNKLLGTQLSKEKFPKLLMKMGLGFEDGRIRETHYAIIPPYRVDFLHQVDVAEDIAIAYGYDNIKEELPDVVTVASESTMTLFQDKIRDILVGYGMLEAKNYHLLSSTYQQEIRNEEVVTLKSSVSEEFDSLRTSLINTLLHTLRVNKVHEYPQTLFELGTVFSPANNQVIERQQLAVTLAGDIDYTRIRQVVDGLLSSLGLVGTFVSTMDERFLAGRCALLRIGNQDIGVLGELSPRVLTQAELFVPVVSCELDLDALLRLKSS